MTLNASPLEPVEDDCHQYWIAEFHALQNAALRESGKEYHHCAVIIFRSESKPHNKQAYREAKVRNQDLGHY